MEYTSHRTTGATWVCKIIFADCISYSKSIHKICKDSYYSESLRIWHVDEISRKAKPHVSNAIVQIKIAEILFLYNSLNLELRYEITYILSFSPYGEFEIISDFHNLMKREDLAQLYRWLIIYNAIEFACWSG